MMKKLLIFVLIALCFTAGKQDNKHFRGGLGLRIPDVGLALDAVYDSRLDTLVSGYRIVNVAIVNNSSEKLFLDSAKDRWKIDDARGVARPAFVSLRREDRGTWEGLNSGLRQNLEYPVAVAPDERVIFSLFFKDSVDLRDFRSISFYSSYLNKVMTYYSEGIRWKEKEPLS